MKGSTTIDSNLKSQCPSHDLNQSRFDGVRNSPNPKFIFDADPPDNFCNYSLSTLYYLKKT